MNINKNDVWREKTELLNLKLKLEFDTKDQTRKKW